MSFNFGYWRLIQELILYCRIHTVLRLHVNHIVMKLTLVDNSANTNQQTLFPSVEEFDTSMAAQ